MAVRPTPSKSAAAGTPGAPAPSASVPTLVPAGSHAGKPALPLGRPVTLIGSRHRAHLHLLSRSVSKAHALIINCGAGGIYIRDLASRTHVIVNGNAVKEQELKHGDTIQIGSFTFRFRDPAHRAGRPKVGTR